MVFDKKRYDSIKGKSNQLNANKKDCLGRQLCIGDVVVFTEYNRCNLMCGVVWGETISMVRVIPMRCFDKKNKEYDYGRNMYLENTNRSPYNLIIVNNDKLFV